MTKGPTLHRDYETRSAADLRKVGAHKYAQHPTTDVIVAVFILEHANGKLDDPIIWFPGMPVPQIVIDAAVSICFPGKEYTFAGHNNAFEQAIDREIMGPRYGFPIIPDEQCDCTMARAAIMGLPLDLDRLTHALNLPVKKDKEGHRLMLQMCKPRKPKKGEATGFCGYCGGVEEVCEADSACSWEEKLYWHNEPEKIERLTRYCVDDVRAEICAGHALFPISDAEKQVWLLDQRMNNRGVAIDTKFVETAKQVVEATQLRLDNEMCAVTGGVVKKATQVDRLKDFCKMYGVELRIDTKKRRNGEEYEAEAIDKEAIEDLLTGEQPLPAQVRRALEIRREAGKSSVKKLQKFELQTCRDGRARGTVQYHGAQPGRWAGRGIQLHNMIRAGITKEEGGWEGVFRDLRDIGLANEEAIELIYGSPIDLISRMLRGTVIARPQHRLIFGDYSNVEGRGCAWASGQHDIVELYANNGKIYEETGAVIFNKTVEEVLHGHETKSNPLWRFIGKETVLGCGYGMGWKAFIRNVKKKSGKILEPAIAMRGIDGWRDKNWRNVEYWRELEDAAKAAIENPNTVYRAGPFSYRMKGRWLQCRMPSGRIIWYYRPTIEPKSDDLEQCGEGEDVPRYRWAIHYWTLHSVTKQWCKTSTWGGKLLQNAIEGLCRDFLAGAKLRLDDMGYIVILSIHDEAISEVPDDFGTVDEFKTVMTELPQWAPGFPLKAECGQGKRYAKA